MVISELFRFVRGATVWTYTSSTETISYGGEDYTPIPITRSEIELKNEISKNGLQITTDLLNPLALDLIGPLTNYRMLLTVYRRKDAAYSVIWKGRLVNSKPSKSTIVLDFESVLTTLSRAGLRPKVQKTCWKALYSSTCGVLTSSFSTAGVISSVLGKTISVSAASGEVDGYFNGGIVQSVDAVKLFFVISHVGSNLLIQGDVTGLEALGSVYLYPGCNKTTQTCNTKFSNIANFGGLPFIPEKNIMDGNTKV